MSQSGVSVSANRTPPGKLIRHASDHISHVEVDDFTDPWKTAETVLIQPGFGRHSSFFYHWVPALSRQYRVVRRDLRGHGHSSYDAPGTTPSTCTIEAICAEIVDTLDQLSIDKVHFIGESTSGMIGEIFAVRHTDRLLSLTICSSPTSLPAPALKFLAFGEDDWPTACRKLGSRGWGRALAKAPGTIGVTDDPAWVSWWLDMISVSSGEGLAQYAEFLATVDSMPFLQSIQIPMLILAPTNSAMVNVEGQKEIQSLVKGSTLQLIAGKGHEIYVDRAQDCLDAILSFIAQFDR